MKTLIKHLPLLLALAACSEDSGGAASGDPGQDPWAPQQPESPAEAPGATGVSLGGAQDFGLFRDIIDRGLVPAPNTLDAAGFFAEHKLDYPAPDCGEDLCLHGLLGMQANMIDGGDCVMLQMGLNSPLRPDASQRPPLDLVASIDVSGSMRGAPLDAVKRGLVVMLESLREGDRVALVAYSDTAAVVLEATDDVQAIRAAVADLRAGGSTNLYDGLFTAFAVAQDLAEPGRHRRVVFLSDGMATAGIQDPVRLRMLAEGHARQGTAVTAIGVGDEFDVEAMRGISEVGAGNFYFLEDAAAVEEVFAEEVETFLMPVALDVEINVQLGPGYRMLAAHGASGWTGGRWGGSLKVPSLFLADRQRAADPIEGGRRGGGGGVMIEVLADPEMLEEAGDLVGRMIMTWVDPETGERLRQTQDIVNPQPFGTVPRQGWFVNDTVEKGFVMLNLYAGLRLATELFQDADAGTALGVLQALRDQVDRWLQDHPDPDIEDDLRIVDALMANIRARAGETPVRRPPNPWPAD